MRKFCFTDVILVFYVGQDLYSYPSMDKGSSGMAFLSGMCSKTASCTLAEAR